MNKYVALLILAVIFFATACKKKSTPLPTSMIVVLDKDTAFTTTSVTTDNQNNGTLYITGKSADGTRSLDIAITGYTGSKKTFVVDYRGVGGNINGNTGLYRDGSSSIISRAGNIMITEVGGDLIKGTFDFYYLQNNFKGTFTAPAK